MLNELINNKGPRKFGQCDMWEPGPLAAFKGDKTLAELSKQIHPMKLRIQPAQASVH